MYMRQNNKEYFIYEMLLTGTMNDDYIMSQNRHQCETGNLII